MLFKRAFLDMLKRLEILFSSNSVPTNINKTKEIHFKSNSSTSQQAACLRFLAEII